MFCPKSILQAVPDIMTKIASESEDKKLRGQEIGEKLKALEVGNTLCKYHALRVTSGLSLSDPIP